MTIAVAVKKEGYIVLATDTLASFGNYQVTNGNYSAKKIIQCGQTYISFAGWGKYENILIDYLSNKKQLRLNSEIAVFKFFHTFYKDLKKSYAYVNDQCTESHVPFGDLDSSFLVVNKHGIFHVDSHMCVTQFQQYYAIGSGQDFGMGAIHALYDTPLTAKQLAEQAVETAKALNLSCGGKTEFVSIKV